MSASPSLYYPSHNQFLLFSILSSLKAKTASHSFCSLASGIVFSPLRTVCRALPTCRVWGQTWGQGGAESVPSATGTWEGEESSVPADGRGSVNAQTAVTTPSTLHFAVLPTTFTSTACFTKQLQPPWSLGEGSIEWWFGGWVLRPAGSFDSRPHHLPLCGAGPVTEPHRASTSAAVEWSS